MITEKYVEFFHGGRFFVDNSSMKIDHRNINAVKVPNDAFAFQFFDIETQTATLEDGTSFNHKKRVNESQTYYPGGTLFSLEDVKNMPGNNEILLSNMECNKWDRIIRTRIGTYFPFSPETSAII